MINTMKRTLEIIPNVPFKTKYYVENILASLVFSVDFPKPDLKLVFNPTSYSVHSKKKRPNVFIKSPLLKI